MQNAFSIDFVSTFVPLPNLHNAFSESGAKTTETACSNKRRDEFPFEIRRDHILMKRLCGSVLCFACSSLMSWTDRCCLFTMRKTQRCHIFQKCHNRLHFTTWFFWHLRGRWIIKQFPLGMSVPGSVFSFFCLFVDEDKLKFPISAEEEEQGVLRLSLQSYPSFVSPFTSHHNVKMRHVIMHHTAPKPHRECCFLINIEVLFIATAAVSGGQRSEKSRAGRRLSGVE